MIINLCGQWTANCRAEGQRCSAVSTPRPSDTGSWSLASPELEVILRPYYYRRFGTAVAFFGITLFTCFRRSVTLQRTGLHPHDSSVTTRVYNGMIYPIYRVAYFHRI